MTTPPPPDHAPTVGRTTWWTGNGAAATDTVQQIADVLWTPESITAAEEAWRRTAEAAEATSRYLTETPGERHWRQRQEADIARAAWRIEDDRERARKGPNGEPGESAADRLKRHRIEDRAYVRQQRDEDRKRRRTAALMASLPWRQTARERARRFRRWCLLTFVSASVGVAVRLVPLLVHRGWQSGAALLVIGYAFDLKTRAWGRVPVSQVRGPGRLVVLILTRVPYASALVAVLGLGPVVTLTSFLFNHHH